MDFFKKGEFLFVPLGGSEQFGVNLNAYGYNDKWLAVDCGIGFADEKYPGIDILLPNPKFLEERVRDLVGLIITHAHEDHIGAVPYLWPRLRCPIYCNKFTSEVLLNKFDEHPACKNADIRVVKPHETIKVGPFKAQFIPVSHSIPDTSSLIIETKAGRVVHSGDWNLDPAPVLGPRTEGTHFIEAAKKGVLAYIGDSTNAEVDGHSGSESDVEQGLEKTFKSCKGRIVITIFSSNIGRVRSIARAAQSNGRSVAIIGRSLHSMIGCARACGYLNDVPDFLSEEDTLLLPKDKIVYIATGSQGEARAQLARIARGDHPSLKLGKGDTVIFSSRAIPGNEKEIITVQNNLSATGVEIITPKRCPYAIHVSGHPARDEIRQMLEWVKPQTVIAVHGERTMLEAHVRFAEKLGVPLGIVPNNGSLIRLYPGPIEIIDHVETGLLAVEPGRIIESDHVSVTQRRKLQFSGTVHVTLVLDSRGDFVADPKVSLIGLHDEDSVEGKELENEILGEVEDILADMTRDELKKDDYIAEEVRVGIRRFVMQVLRIKPMTTVHVVRV